MPLIKSPSKKVLKKNIKTEIKPPKQAAIAYSIRRKYK